MNNKVQEVQEVLDTLGMITVVLIVCGAFTGVVGAVTYATDSLTAGVRVDCIIGVYCCGFSSLAHDTNLQYFQQGWHQVKIDGKVTEGKLPVYECLTEGFHDAILHSWDVTRIRDGLYPETIAELEHALFREATFIKPEKVVVLCAHLIQAEYFRSMQIPFQSKGGYPENYSEAIWALVRVWEFGRKGHEPGSWKKVPVDAFKSAFCRHFLERKRDPLDTESGLPHSYHMLFNSLAVVYLEKLTDAIPPAPTRVAAGRE